MKAPQLLLKAKTTPYWGLLGILLLPWLWLKTQLAVHPDMLWLCECLKRIFAGGRMSDVAYETNPPLSLLLYSGPVLAEKYLGISLDASVLAQSLLILGISTAMLWRVLTNFVPAGDYRHFALMAGYVVANTLMSAIHFGERDHLIGMILIPFVMLQLSMTMGLQKISWKEQGFLFLGAVLILLKPHFGLIPVCFLLHRLYKKRSFSILKDADFVALSVATSVYLGVVWFFFRDYVQVILPDVLKYYQLSSANENLPEILAGLCVMTAGLFAAMEWVIAEDRFKGLLRFLCGTAFVCMIPVLVQNTGYYYHYLPFVIAFMCVAAACVFTLAQRYLGRLAMSAGVVALAVMGYTYAPLPLDYARGSEYASLPLPQEIVKATEPDDRKSFYMFYKNLGLTVETAHYTGVAYASRFSGLWFLAGLYHYQQMDEAGVLTPEESREASADKARFGTMLAEDINTYKPRIMLILWSAEFGGQIDFLDFFKDHPDFKAAMAHYKYERDLSVDETLYYGHKYPHRGNAIFHVFIRQGE